MMITNRIGRQNPIRNYLIEYEQSPLFDEVRRAIKKNISLKTQLMLARPKSYWSDVDTSMYQKFWYTVG